MLSTIKKHTPQPIKRAGRFVIREIPRIHIPAIYRRLTRGDTSQSGEVTACRRLIRPDWPKYVVDVGAYDGLHLSNSYPFIRAGWDAVLIEPHPANFARMKARFAANSKVHCIQKACSNVSGTLPLFLEKKMGAEGGLSATISNDQNQFMASVRSDQSVNVAVEPLSTILADCGVPKDFSLLSVDAEGVDFEVLEGLDDSRFRPRLIITEEYQHEPQKHQRKYALLESRGYINTGLVGCNTIWIAREFR